LPLERGNDLPFQVKLCLLRCQELLNALLILVDRRLESVKRNLLLLQLLILHLQIHIVSLKLLLLRLKPACERFLLGAVCLQLVYTLLHAVNLRVELFQLLVLRLDLLFNLGGALLS